ncbi:MAG: patatin-like phospholipase family protein [Flavobacteriales bacterium]|nr:patatin-like phospholipase family protein [Flavobacteriales bacterium]
MIANAAMTARHTFRTWWRRVLYFFPFQLLLLHLKKNHLLLLSWLLLFGYVTESLGVKYGVPYLFLYPEYFGQVSVLSHAITGFALGGFITAFNLYSYVMHGYRFPFIATIARPFLKFSVNNALIPGVFILFYLWNAALFQYTKELVPASEITLHLLGLVLGILLFLVLSLLYFTRTNTDIIKLLGKPAEEYRPDEPMMDILGPSHGSQPHVATQPVSQRRKAMRWLKRQQRAEKWRVETYLTPRLRIMLARSSAHYDTELLRDVLWQNHINGSIFEFGLVLSFIALGAFSHLPFFAIPAGASAFLLFTIVLMFISALFSWMQGWTGTVIIGVLIGLNLLSQSTEGFLYDTQAYGLDYREAPAAYDRAVLAAMANDTATANADGRAMLATLEHWKEDNARYAPGGKPKLVVINTSGGGLRSMLWTIHCLRIADSLVDGRLMDRTVLMTGSSGGLIGAAYYRQLFAADERSGTTDRYDDAILDELSSDMLNPIAFSFVTNDMFIRYRRVRDGELSYTLDRAEAFERRLNENTRGLLNVRLGAMAEDERQARVPLLVVNPVSINDGRRVIISAQPMAFLSSVSSEARLNITNEAEAIEFRRFFAAHRPDSMKLSTVLRMNASFPYISPVTSLPSEPVMRVMDAGVRDNYGYRTTMSFLHTFREWIAANTSGVVVLQFRDTQKELEVKRSGGSLFARVLDPIGSVYDNFVRVQDQDYDLMQKLCGDYGFDLQVIDFQLRRDEEEQISLSWHLTRLERQRVLRSTSTVQNRAAFDLFTKALQAGDTTVGASVPILAADRAQPR